MTHSKIKVEPGSFFDKFPGFDYNPNAAMSEEFYRLGELQHWKPGSRTWKLNWNACVLSEYDRLIGYRIASLETWQEVCGKLGLNDSLPSITQCRKALSRVYVNIVDLLNCWNTDRRPRQFRNVGQLSGYTRQKKLFFNRSVAKQDKVLRVLLKKLL